MISTREKFEEIIANLPVRKVIVEGKKRDEFEWNQWQSATKSMNHDELPVKEKHIRNLCFGTFQLEGARLFWSMISRIHVESHPIICWKFFYVFHRLLREGHRYVIEDSIRFIIYFEQLKKYWSGLQHNYGLLSYRYCQLIISKLKFHQAHPSIAGNLTIDNQHDIRCLFTENFQSNLQLSLDMMDYLTMILNLVQATFTSLDQSRTNSMTSVGQCRLNPLIISIEDSNILYNFIVKILFQLHEGLPANNLQEHRTRLIELFGRLKLFYTQASKLQYFKSLIKIPSLPENPPNFNGKDDHTSSTVETIFPSGKDLSTLEQRLIQTDALLEQTRSETDDLHRTIAAKDAELLAERQARKQLEEQLRQQTNQDERLKEIRNSKNSNEKFQMLINTYSKLNEEHAATIDQRNGFQKENNEVKDELNRLKEEYQKKSNELIELRQTNDELQARIQSLSNERNDFVLLTETTNERMKEIEQAKQNVEKRLKEFEEEKETLIDLVYEKDQLEKILADRETMIREWAQKFIDLADKQKLIQTNHQNYIHYLKEEYKQSILTYWINKMHQSLDQPEQNDLQRELRMTIQSLKIIEELWKKDSDVSLPMLNELTNLSHHLINLIRWKSADVDYRQAILKCIHLYSQYQTDVQSKESIDELIENFENLIDSRRGKSS